MIECNEKILLSRNDFIMQEPSKEDSAVISSETSGSTASVVTVASSDDSIFHTDDASTTEYKAEFRNASTPEFSESAVSSTESTATSTAVIRFSARSVSAPEPTVSACLPTLVSNVTACTLVPVSTNTQCPSTSKSPVMPLKLQVNDEGRPGTSSHYIEPTVFFNSNTRDDLHSQNDGPVQELDNRTEASSEYSKESQHICDSNSGEEIDTVMSESSSNSNNSVTDFSGSSSCSNSSMSNASIDSGESNTSVSDSSKSSSYSSTSLFDLSVSTSSVSDSEEDANRNNIVFPGCRLPIDSYGGDWSSSDSDDTGLSDRGEHPRRMNNERCKAHAPVSYRSLSDESLEDEHCSKESSSVSEQSNSSSIENDESSINILCCSNGEENNTDQLEIKTDRTKATNERQTLTLCATSHDVNSESLPIKKGRYRKRRRRNMKGKRATSPRSGTSKNKTASKKRCRDPCASDSEPVSGTSAGITRHKRYRSSSPIKREREHYGCSHTYRSLRREPDIREFGRASNPSTPGASICKSNRGSSPLKLEPGIIGWEIGFGPLHREPDMIQSDSDPSPSNQELATDKRVPSSSPVVEKPDDWERNPVPNPSNSDEPIPSTLTEKAHNSRRFHKAPSLRDNDSNSSDDERILSTSKGIHFDKRRFIRASSPFIRDNNTSTSEPIPSTSTNITYDKRRFVRASSPFNDRQPNKRSPKGKPNMRSAFVRKDSPSSSDDEPIPSTSSGITYDKKRFVRASSPLNDRQPKYTSQRGKANMHIFNRTSDLFIRDNDSSSSDDEPIPRTSKGIIAANKRFERAVRPFNDQRTLPKDKTKSQRFERTNCQFIRENLSSSSDDEPIPKASRGFYRASSTFIRDSDKSSSDDEPKASTSTGITHDKRRFVRAVSPFNDRQPNQISLKRKANIQTLERTLFPFVREDPSSSSDDEPIPSTSTGITYGKRRFVRSSSPFNNRQPKQRSPGGKAKMLGFEGDNSSSSSDDEPIPSTSTGITHTPRGFDRGSNSFNKRVYDSSSSDDEPIPITSTGITHGKRRLGHDQKCSPRGRQSKMRRRDRAASPFNDRRPSSQIDKMKFERNKRTLSPSRTQSRKRRRDSSPCERGPKHKIKRAFEKQDPYYLCPTDCPCKIRLPVKTTKRIKRKLRVSEPLYKKFLKSRSLDPAHQTQAQCCERYCSFRWSIKRVDSMEVLDDYVPMDLNE